MPQNVNDFNLSFYFSELIPHKQYCFPGQYGTHIDAPVHFVKGKRYLHELSLKELVGEYYILEQDRYQVEVLTNLDKLPATGAIIYNIVPSIQVSPGFPLRSFAILP
ncbi:cyclase family protein [Paenibacillus sp. 1-18]|uniref:cyclase family protein n=1 Tax=Paenibacillus sp. 1-18 TaxID=1333846 RepID=UPI0022AE7CE7|nr:cyclase family protein [Paenibacillus sp. 1-18]